MLLSELGNLPVMSRVGTMVMSRADEQNEQMSRDEQSKQSEQMSRVNRVSR